MADDFRFGAFRVGEVAAAFSVSLFFGRPRPFFAAIISSFLTFRIKKNKNLGIFSFAFEGFLCGFNPRGAIGQPHFAVLAPTRGALRREK